MDWDAFFKDLDGVVHRQKAVMACSDCKENPTWARVTQFSGEHHFCDTHAKLEPDFGDDSNTHFYWSKL